MNPMLRRVLAAVAGVVVSFVGIAVVQIVNGALFPLPADLDPTDADALAKLIADMPAGAIVGLFASYVVGGAAGGAVARALGQHPGPAWAVGVVQTLAGFANLAAIPHPLWLAIGTTLVHLPSALLGARAVSRRR